MLKNSLTPFAGLDLLTSAVIVLNGEGSIVFANAAAESLLDSSLKALTHQKLGDLFLNANELIAVFEQAVAHQFADKRQDLTLERAGREPLHVHSIVTALDNPELPVLINFVKTFSNSSLIAKSVCLIRIKRIKNLSVILHTRSKIHWAVFVVQRNCWNWNCPNVS